MLWPSFVAAGLVTSGMDLAIIDTVIELAGSGHVAEYSALSSTI